MSWGTVEPSVVSAVLKGCAVNVWMCMRVSECVPSP